MKQLLPVLVPVIVRALLNVSAVWLEKLGVSIEDSTQFWTTVVTFVFTVIWSLIDRTKLIAKTKTDTKAETETDIIKNGGVVP
jgi:hypothetical protein